MKLEIKLLASHTACMIMGMIIGFLAAVSIFIPIFEIISLLMVILILTALYFALNQFVKNLKREMQT